MKKILSSILFLLVSAFALQAEDRIDLGEMKLNTDYRLEDFKNYIGTFTAPKTGVLTCTATTIDVMYPYKQVLDDMYTEGNAYEVSMNNLYGSRSYDLNVEEGTTYVMYANFIMNSNTVFRMSMVDQSSISLTSTSPTEGGTYQVSNGGQVSFDFDKSVTFTSATLTLADETQSIKGTANVNSIYFDIKNKVWELMTAGKAKEGDKLTIALEGVSLQSNSEVLYNGDGKLSLNLRLGSMPIVLESTENTSGNFLSYYTTTNETGLVKLHFSGKVSADQLSAQIKYGSIDKDADGDYYVEQIKPTLSKDGKTVIVNLQGKRRKAQDMVSSGTDYKTVVLGVIGVLDEKGNYAFASGQGSLGSYWYSYDFKEVTASVFCDFTPTSGATLTENIPSIELWITDEAKLSYEGIQFSYKKNGNTQTIVLNNGQFEKEADPDDETASILTIPVPKEVLGSTDVTLSLVNLQCADGADYNEQLTATYHTEAPTGITDTSATPATTTAPLFTLDGRQADKQAKGILIKSSKKLLLY